MIFLITLFTNQIVDNEICIEDGIHFFQIQDMPVPFKFLVKNIIELKINQEIFGLMKTVSKQKLFS